MNAVIFDLDGVIVSTDHYHYRAWKTISELEGIAFDEERNTLLRGVSREESLEILLEGTDKKYTQEQKTALADQKNKIYQSLLSELSALDILPGVIELINDLKKRGIKTAIGSSSKNTTIILEKIALAGAFDAVVTGNDVQRSKPDPEIFLLAAEKLGEQPADCCVIEDAPAGITAAKGAGMKVVGVGSNLEPDETIIQVTHLTDFCM